MGVVREIVVPIFAHHSPPMTPWGRQRGPTSTEARRAENAAPSRPRIVADPAERRAASTSLLRMRDWARLAARRGAGARSRLRVVLDYARSSRTANDWSPRWRGDPKSAQSADDDRESTSWSMSGGPRAARRRSPARPRLRSSRIASPDIRGHTGHSPRAASGPRQRSRVASRCTRRPEFATTKRRFAGRTTGRARPSPQPPRAAAPRGRPRSSPACAQGRGVPRRRGGGRGPRRRATRRRA